MVIVYAVIPSLVAVLGGVAGFYMYKQRVAARELGNKGINSVRATNNFNQPLHVQDIDANRSDIDNSKLNSEFKLQDEENKEDFYREMNSQATSMHTQHDLTT